jgi:hypothetical protein
MLFSLVMPRGGDGSKIARFGGWQSGVGAFFHSLTAALTHTAACVGFAGWALAAVDVECIVLRFILFTILNRFYNFNKIFRMI